MLRAPLLAAAILFLAAPAALAQRDIRTERVQFERGANSAVIEDSITGYDIVHYVLGARVGQHINVSMATDNGANYFNIPAPGEDAVAIFDGSIGENQYEGILPESGDYKVRVYLMRSAARRNEGANYRLEVIITDANDRSSAAAGRSTKVEGTPAARAPLGDALVAGTNYQAISTIPCAMAEGQPTGACPFGVTREGNGSGTVAVTKPDGCTRAIFFEDGEAIGSDGSEADPGLQRQPPCRPHARMHWRRTLRNYGRGDLRRMTTAAANLAGTWSMMKHEHERGLPMKSAGIDSCGGTVGFFLCPISG